MSVLVLGSGAREHSFLQYLFRSRGVKSLFSFPGNAGTSLVSTILRADGIDELVGQCKNLGVDLVVVGSESYLEQGYVDRFLQVGIPCFGPTKAAAFLETSKAEAKQFMRDNDIPTPEFVTFSSFERAKTFVQTTNIPIHQLVLKADGLASGKGVFLPSSLPQAIECLKQIFEKHSMAVIEHRLHGPEISFHVFFDGKNAVFLPLSQDYKREADGNNGPNTGGMGAACPPVGGCHPPTTTFCKSLVEKTTDGLKAKQIFFRGCLYFGLMFDDECNEWKVLEYNVRMGDPEAQTILPLLSVDVYDLLLATATGKLSKVVPSLGTDPFVPTSRQCSVTVVVASKDYLYSTEDVLFKLPPMTTDVPESCLMISYGNVHFSTKRKLIALGGRIFSVTCTGHSIRQARTRCYYFLNQQSLPKNLVKFRNDISL